MITDRVSYEQLWGISGCLALALLAHIATLPLWVPGWEDSTLGNMFVSNVIKKKVGSFNVTIVEANPRRVFDREVIRALSQWKFKPEGDRYIAEIEITFVLN